jgi:N-acetylneuraminic acid mutarotase
MKSSILIVLGAVVLAACRDATSPTPPSSPAPDLSTTRRPPEYIPGQYVVVFRNNGSDVESVAKAVAGRHLGKVKRTYRGLRAMAVELPDAAAAALRRDPSVEYVEQNQVVHLDAEPTLQPGATAGIDRIDQRALPLSGSYSYIADGSGVRAYILDSGLNFGHSDFAGRAALGLDAIGGSGADCYGHGTHVAGTVGGTTYGVAKKVQLVVVRIFDCNGTTNIFALLDGITWVTNNRVPPAVANLSLGLGFSATINQAVAQSIAAGVSYVVAAGNSAADACATSPSSEPRTLSVAASGTDDVFASFSNRGSCVDLVAPGVGITSDWIGSAGATQVLSGTSMAAPHVTGAVALYLSTHTDAQPFEVEAAITSNATQGALTGVPAGTRNALLYTGFLTSDVWQSRAPLPQPRRELASAVVGGLIYAVGGITANGTSAQVTAYDSRTNSWSSKASLPSPRQSADGAALLGGLLYLAGGMNASDVLTKTLYAYNPSTNSWSTRAPMPISSGCGGSRTISGKLYVFTGCTGAGGTTAGLLHRYDPGTNRWTALKSAPRGHRYPAVGPINGKLYVAGGVDGSGSTSVTLDVYDPATNSWQTKAAMSTPRRGAAGAVVNNILYVIGGRDDSGLYLGSVEAYNPANNSWVRKTSLPQASSGLAAPVQDGLIFAIGGRNGAALSANNQAYWP